MLAEALLYALTVAGSKSFYPVDRFDAGFGPECFENNHFPMTAASNAERTWQRKRVQYSNAPFHPSLRSTTNTRFAEDKRLHGVQLQPTVQRNTQRCIVDRPILVRVVLL